MAAKQISRWSAFLLISLFVFLAYFPSLRQTPRGDQISYLAETTSKIDWVTLALKSYDLNRTREFVPGDYILFRPGLYFILGTERFFFGYNLFAWQAFAIFVHLIVLWCLIDLLWLIKNSPFVFIVTAYFSALALSSEMVVWQHVTAYMVFTIALLRVLKYVYTAIQGGELKVKELLFTFLWTLAACLTYEAGNIFAAVLGTFFLGRSLIRKNKDYLLAGIFFLSVGLYMSLSAWNFFQLNLNAVAPSASGFNVLNGLKLIIPIILWWLAHGIFTPEMNFIFAGQDLNILVSKTFKSAFLFFSSGTEILLICLGVAIIILGCLAAGRFIRDGGVKNDGVFCLLLLGLIFGYAAFIGFGRVAQFDLIYLAKRSYYAYIFWILVTVLFYIIFSKFFETIKLKSPLAGMVIGVLIILTLLNARIIYCASQEQARQDKPIRDLVQKVETLRQESESALRKASLELQQSPGNYTIPFLFKKGDPPGKKYTLLEALYPQYFAKP